MNTLLAWRPAADTQGDRLALQSFECTTPRPPFGEPHPRPWEWEVQAGIRHKILKDTARHAHLDQRLKLAYDTEGLAAVVAHARLNGSPAELDVPPGAPVRLLIAIAVAHRHRYNGGEFADYAFTEALYDILDREPDADRISVTAKIDFRNRASMAMAERNGLELAVPGCEDDPLGWWFINLER
ncbi:hypothetical protein [Kitasatospora sp. NPDC090308]|uniref:hypothetical protein n=1 Tax=Kitasatospora sp. NPDC090308 TaxID=3364082 RepID=UPI00381000B2